jgi:hypothetical protein
MADFVYPKARKVEIGAPPVEPPDIDRRPSCLPIDYDVLGRLNTWTMPIMGLGNLVLKADADPITGRLEFIGVTIDKGVK